MHLVKLRRVLSKTTSLLKALFIQHYYLRIILQRRNLAFTYGIITSLVDQISMIDCYQKYVSLSL